MKSQKTSGSSQAIDDEFLAVLFGTDSNVVNPFSEQEWIVKIRSGLPGSAITTLANKIDVPQKDIAAWLHTTTRTIQRTIEANTPLGLERKRRPDVWWAFESER